VLTLFPGLVTLSPRTAQFLRKFPYTPDRIEILEKQIILWPKLKSNFFFNGVNFTPSTVFNNIHNNSVPDLGPVAYMQLYGVSNCGVDLVADNMVLESINYGPAAGCTLTTNNATAPGATTMTAGVQVGCNFAGCASEGPPAIVGGAVAASIVYHRFP
jgi:hypothetical protein